MGPHEIRVEVGVEERELNKSKRKTKTINDLQMELSIFKNPLNSTKNRIKCWSSQGIQHNLKWIYWEILGNQEMWNINEALI